jgi:hypothetical protein
MYFLSVKMYFFGGPSLCAALSLERHRATDGKHCGARK